MITQIEANHGVVLARLCRAVTSKAVSIRADGETRSAYVLDERVGLYVKYSSSRLSPWQFSFSSDHQGEIASLAARFFALFVVLVCGVDGIACLSHAELKRLLDEQYMPTEWIRVARRPREKYTLKGSDSVAPFKVGDNEFPAKVLIALQ